MQWISRHNGELAETVWLGQVAVVSAWRWGRVAGVQVTAGEGGRGRVHFVCFVGLWDLAGGGESAEYVHCEPYRSGGNDERQSEAGVFKEQGEVGISFHEV